MREEVEKFMKYIKGKLRRAIRSVWKAHANKILHLQVKWTFDNSVLTKCKKSCNLVDVVNVSV